MSNNTLQRKLRYAKAQKTNRRIPQWIQMQTGHNCQWNSKQHNWRRSHLKL